MDLSSMPSYLASLPVIVSSLIQQETGPAGSKYGMSTISLVWLVCLTVKVLVGARIEKKTRIHDYFPGTISGSVRAADVDAIAQVAGADWNGETVVYAHKSSLLDMFNSIDQIEQVVGYVSLGYPFGMLASILFGRHHKAVLQSSKPKLFIMGTQDGFTSVKQLKNKLKLCSRSVETHLINGASHFQMEGPAYDAQMELGWFTMCFRCQIKLMSQRIREKESR
ncbi:hypothetical protein ACFX12_009082 [Malus domestica]